MFSFGSLQATVKAVPESLCFVLDAFFDLGRGLFPLVQRFYIRTWLRFVRLDAGFSGVCRSGSLVDAEISLPSNDELKLRCLQTALPSAE